MDGLYLSYVVREMKEALVGARVDRVLQPEKDELHLVLRGASGTHRLLLCAGASGARMHLTRVSKPNPQEPPMFCMLLRKLIGGGRVLDIRQMDGDRVAEIVLDTRSELGEPVTRILSCEMMGRHSNIILRDEAGRIADAIRHVGADVSRVREVKPGLPYAPPPAQDKLSPAGATEDALESRLALGPARLDKALAEGLSGIGAHSARELAMRLTGEESPHLDEAGRRALAGPLKALLAALPAYGPPVLYLSEDGTPQDAFAFPQRHLDSARQKEVPEGPSAALDALYVLRDRHERMRQKSASLQKSVRTHAERTEKKLALHREILADEAGAEDLRVQGELLTASLHLLKPGLTAVTVDDYYSGAKRVIPLDIRLSPAANAQRYYKQYQKARAAQRHAAEQVAKAEEELAFLEAQLDDLRKATDAGELDEIRGEMVRRGYLRASHSRGRQKRPAPTKPLSVLSSDGLTMYIGKNSLQNDRLTAQAAPDALWLHAKGMAGSHVVVEAAGEVPERTLKEAANLAAYFSKGYRSAQVPVDYTRRRYVKKPSGAAPGFVVYTHQRTLYVTPDERAVKRLMGEAE